MPEPPDPPPRDDVNADELHEPWALGESVDLETEDAGESVDLETEDHGDGP